MGKVVWSESAAAAFDDLTDPAQDAVLRAVENIQAFPRMYPIAPSERFGGCRRAVVPRRYLLYYQVSALSEDCCVAAIVDARRIDS